MEPDREERILQLLRQNFSRRPEDKLQPDELEELRAARAELGPELWQEYEAAGRLAEKLRRKNEKAAALAASEAQPIASLSDAATATARTRIGSASPPSAAAAPYSTTASPADRLLRSSLHIYLTRESAAALAPGLAPGMWHEADCSLTPSELQCFAAAAAPRSEGAVGLPAPFPLLCVPLGAHRVHWGGGRAGVDMDAPCPSPFLLRVSYPAVPRPSTVPAPAPPELLFAVPSLAEAQAWLEVLSQLEPPLAPPAPGVALGPAASPSASGDGGTSSSGVPNPAEETQGPFHEIPSSAADVFTLFELAGMGMGGSVGGEGELETPLPASSSPAAAPILPAGASSSAQTTQPLTRPGGDPAAYSPSPRSSGSGAPSRSRRAELLSFGAGASPPPATGAAVPGGASVPTSSFDSPGSGAPLPLASVFIARPAPTPPPSATAASTLLPLPVPLPATGVSNGLISSGGSAVNGGNPGSDDRVRRPSSVAQAVMSWEGLTESEGGGSSAASTSGASNPKQGRSESGLPIATTPATPDAPSPAPAHSIEAPPISPPSALSLAAAPVAPAVGAMPPLPGVPQHLLGRPPRSGAPPSAPSSRRSSSGTTVASHGSDAPQMQSRHGGGVASTVISPAAYTTAPESTPQQQHQHRATRDPTTPVPSSLPLTPAPARRIEPPSTAPHATLPPTSSAPDTHTSSGMLTHSGGRRPSRGGTAGSSSSAPPARDRLLPEVPVPPGPPIAGMRAMAARMQQAQLQQQEEEQQFLRQGQQLHGQRGGGGLSVLLATAAPTTAPHRGRALPTPRVTASASRGPSPRSAPLLPPSHFPPQAQAPQQPRPRPASAYVPHRMDSFHRALGIPAPSSSRRPYKYHTGYEKEGWAWGALAAPLPPGGPAPLGVSAEAEDGGDYGAVEVPGDGGSLRDAPPVANENGYSGGGGGSVAPPIPTTFSHAPPSSLFASVGGNAATPTPARVIQLSAAPPAQLPTRRWSLASFARDAPGTGAVPQLQPHPGPRGRSPVGAAALGNRLGRSHSVAQALAAAASAAAGTAGLGRPNAPRSPNLRTASLLRVPAQVAVPRPAFSSLSPGAKKRQSPSATAAPSPGRRTVLPSSFAPSAAPAPPQQQQQPPGRFELSGLSQRAAMEGAEGSVPWGQQPPPSRLLSPGVRRTVMWPGQAWPGVEAAAGLDPAGRNLAGGASRYMTQEQQQQPGAYDNYHSQAPRHQLHQHQLSQHQLRHDDEGWRHGDNGEVDHGAAAAAAAAAQPLPPLDVPYFAPPYYHGATAPPNTGSGDRHPNARLSATVAAAARPIDAAFSREEDAPATAVVTAVLASPQDVSQRLSALSAVARQITSLFSSPPSAAAASSGLFAPSSAAAAAPWTTGHPRRETLTALLEGTHAAATPSTTTWSPSRRGGPFADTSLLSSAPPAAEHWAHWSSSSTQGAVPALGADRVRSRAASAASSTLPPPAYGGSKRNSVSEQAPGVMAPGVMAPPPASATLPAGPLRPQHPYPHDSADAAGHQHGGVEPWGHGGANAPDPGVLAHPMLLLRIQTLEGEVAALHAALRLERAAHESTQQTALAAAAAGSPISPPSATDGAISSTARSAAGLRAALGRLRSTTAAAFASMDGWLGEAVAGLGAEIRASGLRREAVGGGILQSSAILAAAASHSGLPTAAPPAPPASGTSHWVPAPAAATPTPSGGNPFDSEGEPHSAIGWRQPAGQLTSHHPSTAAAPLSHNPFDGLGSGGSSSSAADAASTPGTASLVNGATYRGNSGTAGPVAAPLPRRPSLQQRVAEALADAAAAADDFTAAPSAAVLPQLAVEVHKTESRHSAVTASAPFVATLWDTTSPSTAPSDAPQLWDLLGLQCTGVAAAAAADASLGAGSPEALAAAALRLFIRDGSRGSRSTSSLLLVAGGTPQQRVDAVLGPLPSARGSLPHSSVLLSALEGMVLSSGAGAGVRVSAFVESWSALSSARSSGSHSMTASVDGGPRALFDLLSPQGLAAASSGDAASAAAVAMRPSVHGDTDHRVRCPGAVSVRITSPQEAGAFLPALRARLAAAAAAGASDASAYSHISSPAPVIVLLLDSDGPAAPSSGGRRLCVFLCGAAPTHGASLLLSALGTLRRAAEAPGSAAQDLWGSLAAQLSGSPASMLALDALLGPGREGGGAAAATALLLQAGGPEVVRGE